MNGPIAIIGGGWAGLAAAVELASHGRFDLDLFEASPILGGRARRATIDNLTLDNGAHILLGAYGAILRLLRQVGVEEDRVLRRLPLTLLNSAGLRLTARHWPAPWHLVAALLRARGLPLGDKFKALAFMLGQRWRGFAQPVDGTVAQLLAHQGAVCRQQLWEPLCLAALNTPAEAASARIFLNVLRDSLAARRSASDLLLPCVDLSAVFPEPAANWLGARGARIHRGARVRSLRLEIDGFHLDDSAPYAQVIIAVAPWHLPHLLEALPGMGAQLAQTGRMVWNPITTVYLTYPPTARLEFPMLGLADGAAQWLFDRGALCGQPGLFAAVSSAPPVAKSALLSPEAPARAVHEQIARCWPNLNLPSAPLRAQVVTERRATFAATPDLARPSTATALPGLWLAGDYVAGDYPATLEGAVMSGIRAARCALALSQ